MVDKPMSVRERRQKSTMGDKNANEGQGRETKATMGDKKANEGEARERKTNEGRGMETKRHNERKKP